VAYFAGLVTMESAKSTTNPGIGLRPVI
jgi:hypothetical protein